MYLVWFSEVGSLHSQLFSPVWGICMLRSLLFDGSGVRDEKRAGKTDFHRESNSGSVTGSPVH